ncbi:spore germination protein [Priestia endophytica]|uniref:spore germination protein n=1 Tax=Priestia filamentosa TaxID=1402861 RepID=UPI002E1A3448|nr:spore germination protein [Priestia filamentosa]
MFFKKRKKKEDSKSDDTHEEQSPAELLQRNLTCNIKRIKEEVGYSSDVIIREFSIGYNEQIPSAIVFIDGLVEASIINDSLLKMLLEEPNIERYFKEWNPIQLLQTKVVALDDVKIVLDWETLFQSLVDGETIVLIDGYPQALSGSARGGEQRAIEEPQTQVSIRGPKDGFTESIRTNTALLRRRIKNTNFRMETKKLGKATQTDVSILYINGIAKDKIVQEVRDRISGIDVGSILESGNIEELIEDETFTTFPTVYHTERPDVVAANLLEGRVAILVDGTPFALVVPALFIQFFQSPDDYYTRFDISSGLRFLRIMIFFISLIAPSSYIAATTFHQEMIPTQLAFSIAAQREVVPFPSFVEALIMEVTFEILREAGVRMPRAVGQAVSIVGALVIGQAAVQAGLVSPAMIIIVSLTAIASFATPSFSIAISARVIRFALMVCAAAFGFYGIFLGLIIMVVHLCSLRSFGVPYMSPLSPLDFQGLRDTFIRAPFWSLDRRPALINEDNVKRQGKNQRPYPPTEEEENQDET